QLVDLLEDLLRLVLHRRHGLRRNLARDIDGVAMDDGLAEPATRRQASDLTHCLVSPPLGQRYEMTTGRRPGPPEPAACLSQIPRGLAMRPARGRRIEAVAFPLAGR